MDRGFCNENGAVIELSRIKDGTTQAELGRATFYGVEEIVEVEEQDVAVVEEEKEEEMTTEQGSERVFPAFNHMEAVMYNAAVEGDARVMQAIVEQALRVVRTPTGNSILHIHVLVPSTDTRRVNVQFLERVLVSDPSLVEVTNDRGETPLHIAARYGHLEAVTVFLDGAGDLLLRTNKDGDTALHIAVQNKHVDVVEYLLDRSGLVMMEYTINTVGKTPLHLAVESGSLDLVTLLLHNFTVPQYGTDLTGSMLHVAVLQGDSAIVSKIMEMEPCRCLIHSRDRSGLTPIHYAAGSDSDILKVLLKYESSRTAVYNQDSQGRTAAHIAAQCNDVLALKELVRCSPDCCEIVDKDGRNVVHYAAMLGCIEALDYFLTESHFSDITTMGDCKGDTPLHLLARSIPDFPVACLRQIKLLIPKLKSWKLKKIYNNANHTPGDVAHFCDNSVMEPAYQDVMREFVKEFPHDGYTKHWLQRPVMEYNKLIIETQRKDSALSMLKAARNHLLVATLIATLAFAAGLNVPGGFNQNSDDAIKGGTAILAKKPTFCVFLIADTISLTSSVIAILIYFLVNLGKGRGSAKILFFWAFGATSISMFALMVAFMAGTYSLVQPSKMFALLITLIPSVFIFCYTVFLCMFVSFIKATRSIRRLDPGKLKTAV